MDGKEREEEAFIRVTYDPPGSNATTYIIILYKRNMTGWTDN